MQGNTQTPRIGDIFSKWSRPGRCCLSINRKDRAGKRSLSQTDFATLYLCQMLRRAQRQMITTKTPRERTGNGCLALPVSSVQRTANRETTMAEASRHWLFYGELSSIDPNTLGFAKITLSSRLRDRAGKARKCDGAHRAVWPVWQTTPLCPNLAYLPRTTFCVSATWPQRAVRQWKLRNS